jgi:CubicO group peptidase (beta-lactamase class C family)/S-formylglutathione hydrolase FrmB
MPAMRALLSMLLFLTAPFTFAGDDKATDGPWVNRPSEKIDGVEHNTFESKSLGKPVGFNVYLPPQYHTTKGQRFPVVYHLHGRTDSESSHLYNLRLLDKAVRDGVVPPVICVYAYAGRQSWFTDWKDGPIKSEAIFRELVSHVDNSFRTSNHRDGRGLLGWSMGGFGALKLALQSPEHFGSVVCFAGAYLSLDEAKKRLGGDFERVFGKDDAYFDKHSPVSLLPRRADAIRGKVALRLAVGEKDFLLDCNRRMHALLDQHKIAHEYEEFAGVGHNPKEVYEAQLVKALKFFALTFAKAPGTKAESIEETRARILYDAKVIGTPSVFAGDQFPPVRVEVDDKAKLLGPLTVKTTFYDAKGNSVAKPAGPGFYGAMVEIGSAHDRVSNRYVTVYRLAEPIDAVTKFDPSNLDDIAKKLGANLAVLKKQATAFAELVKDRPFKQWAGDAKVARFLAGLSLSTEANDPAAKHNDAFAMERQAWVDVRRRINGWDKMYSKPFAAPKAILKRPVREGTLDEAGMKPDAAAKIDAVLKEWAADTDEAFAVCVVRRGVIVLHEAYGTRDGKPMTVNTKSWMASITKAMSATLMMMLVEQGLVGLDDPVEKFLPSFRGLKTAAPITIRHLYTHTAGMRDWPNLNDEQPDVEERLALAAPFLRVGEEFGYNGNSYMLAGKIIEAVSGEAIPRCFHRHLLGPLGNHRTDVVGTQADAYSVPLDMARFGQLLLYGGRQDFTPDTLQQMLPEKLSKVLGKDTTRTFGIGLDGSRTKFGHGAASAATFSVDRDNELIVVMTRNRIGTNYDKYNGKFWQAIQDGVQAKPLLPGKQSQWNGYPRYDFVVAGKPLLVVAPKNPAPGNPWIWHGEFFGHKPAPDIALLGKGFHIVYASVPDQLGGPDAVKHWNAVYKELTETHGFGRKPGLVGLSRGGLYCYNWAIANPDKVGCIYADAAVCDLKSWPGGKGKGKGSPRDWKLALERYGFKSDAEAVAYPGNPVDNLAPLAKMNVPLLHVFGDADDVVPWEENTGLVAERYRKLGGPITLIRKPGVGHHPHGLEDSTPIIDFLAKHAK